ncbi:hypothetical protein KIPB_001345 [Kipferlia bialata]|nr:hypothetical protein KIPB_001345 [Kipferlia bialata]|eukprot:g1345.t1
MSATGADARVSVSPQVLDRARRHGREHGATVTGLVNASLIQAIGSMYLECHPEVSECSVSMSIVVDMRPYCDPSLLSDADTPLRQAIGTVTLAHPVTTSAPSADTLLQMAGTVTQDMQHRIERHEHVLSSKALSDGRFDAGPPSATIELSNHGSYAGPPFSQAEVLTTQRFDGYPGLSVLVHSVSAAEGTALCLGVAGCEMGKEVLDRAAHLFGVMGTE